MKFLRLSQYESSWLKLLGLLALVIVALFFVRTLFPKNHSDEPLADQAILSLLLQGKAVPTPAFDPHAQFHGIKATPPTLASLSVVSGVLGANTSDKRIEVDLTRQRLYAFEGDHRVYEFLVSTGKWAPTPTGEFHIWVKLRSTLMHGGQGADYYYLPNVPYVMFFASSEVAPSRGFSLHGTYWHNNFGHPMSHGCVNMRTEDAKVLFEWATPTVTDAKAWSTNATADNPGTRIVIYGEAPKE